MHQRSRTLAAALSALAATTVLTLPAAHAAPPREAAPYDLNGDGFPEVVVGVANGTVDGRQQAGHVAVVPGSATGPATAQRRTVSQASTGVPGAPEPFDQFGAHHTSADLDRDGYADLAVGGARSVGPDDPDWEPRYPVASGVGGTVRVLYGGPKGPAGGGEPVDFSQETPGVPGTGAGESERGDAFGFAVSAADTDADGHADLAIGAPGEAAGTKAGAGRVTLLYGSPTGLRADRSYGVHQDAPGVPGGSEAQDAFGAKVVLRDTDGDRRADPHTAATGEDGGDGRVWSLSRAADDGAVTGVGYSAASLHLPAPIRGLEFGRGLGN
ncbi:hypothetical protein [Streptomyces buecherae]|uniref:hypothetical protein n=1 Tax=Streptomyces buecherae TaxID=2763006 RepID=UPI003687E6E4